MKDHDLDRIIDAATEQMMSQQPSQALTDSVMARIRAGEEGSRPRRFVWATVGASAAACGVIAMLMVNSASQPPVENPGRASSATMTTESIAPVVVQPDSTVANAGSRVASSETRPLRAPRVRHAASDPPMTQAEFEALAGTAAFESISPQPIELAAIAIESAPVDQIVIEAITIEPLSASND